MTTPQNVTEPKQSLQHVALCAGVTITLEVCDRRIAKGAIWLVAEVCHSKCQVR